MLMPEPSEIKNLREAAQIELSELAKLTSLSVPQLKQLEEGGDHLFYSSDIKQQAIKRVLRIIDPTRIVDPSLGSNNEAEQSQSSRPKNVIEEIVRLSNKGGRSKSILPSAVYTKKNPSAMAWGAGIIVIAIIVMYISPWDSQDKDSSTEIITPVTKEQNNQNTVTTVLEPLKSESTNSQITSQIADPLTDSKNAIISSAKTTVDTSLNAVGTTLSRASEVVKNTPVISTTSAPANTSKDVKEVQKQTLVSSSATPPNNAGTPPMNAKSSEATSPGVSSAANTTNPVDPCQLLGSDTAPTALSSAPTKAGSYVYFTALDKASACVQDGSGKKTTVTLSKEQGMSVYGKGPWQIASPDFSKLQMYFQGTRVLPADTNGKRVQLIEQNIPQ